MSKAISTSHFAADAAEMHLRAYNANLLDWLDWLFSRKRLVSIGVSLTFQLQHRFALPKISNGRSGK
jgi:hypothetical protein